MQRIPTLLLTIHVLQAQNLTILQPATAALRRCKLQLTSTFRHQLATTKQELLSLIVLSSKLH